MKRKVAIGVGLIALLLAVRLVVTGLGPPPSDVDLIQELIEEARLGAESGEPNRITDAIAENAVVQGMTRRQVVQLVRTTLRQAEEIRVNLSTPLVSVAGDTATAQIDKAGISYKWGDQDMGFELRHLKLHLRKAKIRKWLVLSERRWQITYATAGSVPDVGGY